MTTTRPATDLRRSPATTARRELPASARACLPVLERFVGIHAPRLARRLVDWAVRIQLAGRSSPARAGWVTATALNRRRRAARSWIEAVLAGGIGDELLVLLTDDWIPELTGAAAGASRDIAPPLACLEFLRGLMTAQIVHDPVESMVPEAKALHALDEILATHAAAIRESRGSAA